MTANLVFAAMGAGMFVALFGVAWWRDGRPAVRRCDEREARHAATWAYIEQRTWELAHPGEQWPPRRDSGQQLVPQVLHTTVEQMGRARIVNGVLDVDVRRDRVAWRRGDVHELRDGTGRLVQRIVEPDEPVWMGQF